MLLYYKIYEKKRKAKKKNKVKNITKKKWEYKYPSLPSAMSS